MSRLSNAGYGLVKTTSLTNGSTKNDLGTSPQPGVINWLRHNKARMVRTLKNQNSAKRIVFNLMLYFGFYNLVLKVVTIVLYAVYSEKANWDTSSAWLGITLTDLIVTLVTILILAVDFIQWNVRLRDAVAEANKASRDTSKVTASSPGVLRRAVYVGLLICNLFAMVSTIIAFVAESSFFLNTDVPDYYELGVGLEVVGSLAAAACVVFTVLITIYMWWPIVMFSQCIILVGSILQFLVTTVCILLNMGRLTDLAVGNVGGQPVDHTHLHLRFVSFYPHFAVVLSCAGFVGAGLLFEVNVHNRLSQAMVNQVQYYMMLLGAGIILSLVWLIMSLVQAARIAIAGNIFVDIYIANPILAFAGIVINVICFFAARSFIRRPKTRLQVEEYDLRKLSPEQLQAWAGLIDTYDKLLVPGAPSGREALDLLMAYVKSPMKNLHCKVLRVFDVEVRDREQGRQYEQVRAWAGLDNSSIFKSSIVEQAESATTTVVGSAADAPKVSKNALKRQQHKDNKKAKKNNRNSKQIANLPVSADPEPSPEQIQADIEFRATLIATEALVLMTYIDDYDLTSPIQGKAGAVLRRLFGPKSYLKLLTVRFGLLATHWPFRQTTFYTSPTKKPNARAVAILRAISHWNNSLPRQERSSLILDPLYAHNGMENMFKPAGWLTTHVPPSHVIDLRSYRGKTVTEYLKAIKYRNQATAFKAANGEVVETTEFSRANCEIAMELWHKIAEKRTSEGHTAVLADPTVEFLMSLGSRENNANGFRKLLFLKVNGEVIASCVLFILGDTITSDIQGLDHESARTYKAYFVMMQETITIALRDGISFVDFGPTTSKPKMDIGAAEVPLVGGLYAREPLSTMVNLFANQVNSG